MAPKRETPKAAAAFAVYCTLGPTNRSLKALAAHLGKSPGYESILSRWSKEFRWQERVKKYDLDLIERKAESERKKHEQEIEQMNDRHASIGVTQQLKAIEQINALIKAQSFGAIASVQLLKFATDLERLARGAPTEQKQLALTGKDGGAIETHTEPQGSMYIDLSKLSSEQLDRLEQLIDEVERAEDPQDEEEE
jgi:hypothetical protein